MNTIFNQKGASIIAIIAIMLILAVMGVALVTLITTGSDISVNQLQSEQALYVAEGGMEKAVFELKNGTACNALLSGSIGAGSFTITGMPLTNSIALFANIIATDPVIPVNSTAGFASHGRIRIENEDINYASLSTSCAPFASPACFTGAQRGVAGSAAALHNTGAGVNTAQDECFINSTGTISTNAQRVVERAVQNPGAMMVYAKANGNGNVYYRRWDGTNWGPERTDATAVSPNIQYLVLKFARSRNEAILGTLDSTGDIRVQVWNGNTQTWSATTLLANIGTTNDVYRGFDIEYETLGDRAVVVYNNANNRNPAYRIWNGTAWTAAVTLDTELGANYNTTSASAPIWIELAANPLGNSNEIVLLTLDAAASPDVYGVRWNGSAWSRMSAATGSWDTTAADSGVPAVSPSKVIDVAYEQLSGRAMFIWGDATATDNYYRIWDGTNLSAANILLDIPAMSGAADWVRLVPRPNSNELMYGVQDSALDLNTRRWSGPPAVDPSWDTAVQHPEHDTSTEDVDSRNFDIVFETHPANPGQAWLVWGFGFGVRQNRWNGASWAGSGNIAGSDDTALVQLVAHPVTGTLFAGIYQSSSSASDDINEMHQVNGVQTWSGYVNIWGGPTVGDPVLERVFIATERFFPIINWKEVY